MSFYRLSLLHPGCVYRLLDIDDRRRLGVTVFNLQLEILELAFLCCFF